MDPETVDCANLWVTQAKNLRSLKDRRQRWCKIYQSIHQVQIDFEALIDPKYKRSGSLKMIVKGVETIWGQAVELIKEE